MSPTVDTPTAETVVAVVILPDGTAPDVQQFASLLSQVREQRATLATALVSDYDVTRLYELATRMDTTVYRTFTSARHVNAHNQYVTLTHAFKAWQATQPETFARAIAYNTVLSVARTMVAVGPSTVSKDAAATAQLRALNAVLGSLHRAPIAAADNLAVEAMKAINVKAQARAAKMAVASDNVVGMLDSAPENADK